MITVKAKVDAGFHPGLGTNIIKDQEYTISEKQFADQLFERPAPDWLAPWEMPAETPNDETKTGGKKK